MVDRARESGMGLIGMKAARYIAGRSFLGGGNPHAFDEFYSESLTSARNLPNNEATRLFVWRQNPVSQIC